MFAVKPVPEFELQKEICAALNANCPEGSSAYFAAELSENGDAVSELIGVCCFFQDENAEICTLCPATGREDDEAMIIMCRAVMNFLWRQGSLTAHLPFTAGPSELLKKCGLKMCEDGYSVDLNEFYKSPCHYSEAQSEK